MKLSKGFNKVLSLVLTGAMVLTGISVADTKKADAATAVVKITDSAGEAVTDEALLKAFSDATSYETSENTKTGLGIDLALVKTYLTGKGYGDTANVSVKPTGNAQYAGANFGTLSAFENGAKWNYVANTNNKEITGDARYTDGSKIFVIQNDNENQKMTGLKISASKSSFTMPTISEEKLVLAANKTLSIFVGAKANVELAGGNAFNAALTGEDDRGNDGWNLKEISVVYNTEKQSIDITWNGQNKAELETAGTGDNAWQKLMISMQVQATNGSYESAKVELPLELTETADDATADITGTPVTTDNIEAIGYTATIVEPYEYGATPTPTAAPTKAPTSGGAISGGGTSGSGSSGSGTSGAGTGEPTELPEEDQFNAFIGVSTSGWYPQAGVGDDGYEVNGFDQQDSRITQTEIAEIDSTGVYTVALTNSMAGGTEEGVHYFALLTDLATTQQEKNGLIVKPVAVTYGDDDFTEFPITSWIDDSGSMRYSFANEWATSNPNANPFDCDQFVLPREGGIYIKFVVAFSEQDAEKLVKNYDDTDSFEDIKKDIAEEVKNLAGGATPTPTPEGPTAKPDVKPTAKPTAAPTLKVAGKITMGAKEKVTVKATTNQASVKATSSKTKVVKVSAKGKNIKLTAAKKAGKANITVTAGNKKATIKVTVKAAPKKIKVAKKTVNVKRGKKATTKVKFTPKKAGAYTIKVTNAKQLKKKKVTVTVANGKITVKANKKAKKGTFTVKLQTYNKKKTTFKVKVK